MDITKWSWTESCWGVCQDWNILQNVISKSVVTVNRQTLDKLAQPGAPTRYRLNIIPPVLYTLKWYILHSEARSIGFYLLPAPGHYWYQVVLLGIEFGNFNHVTLLLFHMESTTRIVCGSVEVSWQSVMSCEAFSLLTFAGLQLNGSRELYLLRSDSRREVVKMWRWIRWIATCLQGQICEIVVTLNCC